MLRNSRTQSTARDHSGTTRARYGAVERSRCDGRKIERFGTERGRRLQYKVASVDGAEEGDVMGLLYRKGSRAAAAQKIEKELTVVNRLGLHARPAAMFVRIASRHRAEIWVSKEGEEVNGKSIMGLMMLAAGQGSKLRIRCDGPDADKAMEELEELVKAGFNED